MIVIKCDCCGAEVDEEDKTYMGYDKRIPNHTVCCRCYAVITHLIMDGECDALVQHRMADREKSIKSAADEDYE